PAPFEQIIRQKADVTTQGLVCNRLFGGCDLRSFRLNRALRLRRPANDREREPGSQARSKAKSIHCGLPGWRTRGTNVEGIRDSRQVTANWKGAAKKISVR